LRVLPSQVVQAIEGLIGAQPTDLYSRRITHNFLAEVNSILSLLNDVPTELIDLPFIDYVELTRCRAIMAASAAHWGLGGIAPVRDVNGKDAIERVRRLMQQCQDQLPPPEPELPFVDDVGSRVGIQSQIHTAWVNFSAQNWLGATTFAGAALEAILLWSLEKSNTKPENTKHGRPINELRLAELIDEATKLKLVSKDTSTIAHSAKDARNLIHPGKVARSGVACTKASALTALAGLYRTIEDIGARMAVNG
jgi:hypothetical protein